MPTPPHFTQDLATALREAADVLGSERTLASVLRMVNPGVYVRIEITVTRESNGDYKLNMGSATHGTPCNLLFRKDLSGAAVALEELAELKRTLKGEGPKAKEDRRFPDDWK